MVAFFLLFGFNNKGTQNKKGKRVLVGYLATPTASLPSRVEAALGSIFCTWHKSFAYLQVEG